MIIENSEALKGWLTNCLGRMCDADPAALAKYVLALVKKDKTENELREFCLDQLDVFLLKDTKTFVDLLFETLRTKSYLQKSDLSVNETTTTSSPSCNSNVTAKTTLSSSDSNLTESAKVEKSDSEIRIKEMTETKNLSLVHKNKPEIKSTYVNTDHCKSRPIHKSSNSVKSRSGSPVRKTRQRSRSREGEDQRKRCAPDEDKCKRHFPSKKARIRKHSGGSDHYSKGNDEKLGIKNDKKNCKVGTDRDQTNQEGNLDKDLLTKSRSRSNSWDKRSRSCSWSSHSSSRSSSRSRSRDRSRDMNNRSDSRNTLIKLDTLKQPVSDHGDTDYRQKHPSVSNTQPQSCNNYSSKGPKRCQDYDEKGYCMRGDLCLYDHGADPLVVEDVSVLNFGVPVSQVPSNESTTNSPAIITRARAGSKSPLQPPPPVSPPPLPPPPPPLPPPPPPGSYAPEPYNPEAPGMNVAPRDHINYWVPTNLTVHHIPPPHHSPGPAPTSGIPSVLFNMNEPPPYHNSKPQRTRELIGVPTVDDVNSSCLNIGKGGKQGEKPSSTHNYGVKNHPVSLQMDKEVPSTSNDKDGKRKGFDYNRLGPNPKKVLKMGINRCTLEVRKIPKQFNSIAMLNNHFSKFGKIVNLQVGYDGDPEAALVQFMSHAEAANAYRSTDAVFNNRFIKVFWHNKDDRFNVIPNEKPQSIIAETKSSDKNLDTTTTSEVEEKETNKNELQKNNCDKISENRAVMYVPKAASHRTVYQPSFIRRSNIGATTTMATVRRQTEDLRKDALYKRLELHKKKQEFLESQIQHQKLFLEQLSKCRNEKERDFLKKTLQRMSAKISELQNDVKKDSEELKNLFKTASVQTLVAKTEAEKELLDAEMDLYNKQHRGDDTAELLSKVYELKQKAKAFGAIDNCSSVGQGSLAPKLVNSRFLGKGCGSTLTSSRTVDHRPRRIIVSGSTSKDVLLKHFQQFGDIENMEENASGIIFMFRTRMEAEGAFTLGSKLGDEQLSISWFHDSQGSAAENVVLKDDNDPKDDKSTDDSKNDASLLVDEDEEDEEEDSEARSWRR